MDNNVIKKNDLRNKLFSKFFQNKEGIPASMLFDKLSFIRKKYDNINKLITKEDEGITLDQNVKFIKKVKLNNNEYLLICTSSFNFIVIDISNKKTLNINEVHDIFSDEFFRKNIEEHGLSEFYNFLPTKYIDEILEIYNSNEFLFTLPIYIMYEVNIGEATATLILNTNCEKAILFFEAPNQFLYEHLVLGKNLEPTLMSASTLDHDKGFGVANKVKDIIIPYDVIPKELLLAINEYDMVNVFNNLKYKKIDDVKKEVFDKYQKSLLDLTEEEVDTLSVRIKKEYRWMLKCLLIEIGKYTKDTVIYAETLRDIHSKLEEFKEAYYKKHSNEKK